MTLTQKRDLVGEKGSFSLNLRPARSDRHAQLSGQQVGLQTTHLQAAFAPTRGFGTLRSPADVVRFLTTQARLFGKPVRGSGSFGSLLIRKLDNMIATLGNGQTISVSKLAEEVATHQTYGYIFQNAITPHPAITTLTGSNALSTMRVVTVIHGASPEIPYTL